MIISHKMQMDLVRSEVTGQIPLICGVQGDRNTRQIDIELLCNGSPWQIPEGVTVQIRYSKPDGTGGIYDTLESGAAAWSIEEGMLSVSLAPQMFTCPGLVRWQVALIQGADILSCFTVHLLVERELGLEALEDDSYVNLQAWLTAELTQALTDARESGQFRGATFVPSVSEEGVLSWSNDSAMENPAPVDLKGHGIIGAGAGGHNAVFRGKQLGTAVSAAQWAAIADGTFTDMFVGDYWKINGIVYRIAAFDYYVGWAGSYPAQMKNHHVTLVPDTNLYMSVMNDTKTTEGGYYNSKLHQEGLASARETIQAAFGAEHLLNTRRCMSNAVTNGKPSGIAWYDTDVVAMTEQNVMGATLFAAANDGTNLPQLQTNDNSQYPLFAMDPARRLCNANFWLRDVASAERFIFVAAQGTVSTAETTATNVGVRPAFTIYQA